MDRIELEREADRAAAAGQLEKAEQLLESTVQLANDDPSPLLKLAGVQRASGNVEKALATVNRALAIAPRDFMALLMRASLLEKLGGADAGPAWGRALAQKPSGELPAHLQAIVEKAQRSEAAWIEGRDSEMSAALAAVQAPDEPESTKRINRFKTNILRKTRHFHSEPTDFHYPGLPEVEFYPNERFSWMTAIEAATQVITAEFRSVMEAERAELVPYVQYDDHIPLDQWAALNHNKKWSAIHLLQNGERVEASARHCPETMRILDQVDQPNIPGASPNAMFSLLAPNTAIPPHVGVNNTRVVCHLPLIVPEGCWFRVGAETRFWECGTAFAFDDTIEHEALNPSDQLRVVFIFDAWNPDLGVAEREAVAALIGCEVGSGAGQQ